MAVVKTSKVGALIFYPLGLVSALMTIILFYDFADKVWSGIMMAIVGMGMEGLKIFFLSKLAWDRQFNRKSSRINLIGYVALAFLCAFASLVFGVATIERKSIMDDARSVKSKEIGMKIADAEKQLANLSAGDDFAAQRQMADRQIEALTAQIVNVTVGVSERSIEITREIERLQARRAMIGQGESKQRKADAIALITELRAEYGKQMILENDTKKSFQVVADVVHVPQNMVMVVFLFFVTIFLELGIAVTSGSALADFKPEKVKKEKDPDQLKFDLSGESK